MINREWHLAHKMPKNASREQRIKWHAAHMKACSCRKPPESLRAEIARLAKA